MSAFCGWWNIQSIKTEKSKHHTWIIIKFYSFLILGWILSLFSSFSVETNKSICDPLNIEHPAHVRCSVFKLHQLRASLLRTPIHLYIHKLCSYSCPYHRGCGCGCGCAVSFKLRRFEISLLLFFPFLWWSRSYVRYESVSVYVAMCMRIIHRAKWEHRNKKAVPFNGAERNKERRPWRA